MNSPSIKRKSDSSDDASLAPPKRSRAAPAEVQPRTTRAQLLRNKSLRSSIPVSRTPTKPRTPSHQNNENARQPPSGSKAASASSAAAASPHRLPAPRAASASARKRGALNCQVWSIATACFGDVTDEAVERLLLARVKGTRFQYVDSAAAATALPRHPLPSY